MKASLSTERLARWTSKRPWTTIGIWAVMLVLALVVVTKVGGNLTQSINITANPESLQADKIIKDRLGSTTDLSEMVIVQSSTLTVDDPQFKSAVAAVYSGLTGLGTDIVKGGMAYYMPGGQSLVSPDRHTTIIPITMPKGGDAHIDEVYDASNAAIKGQPFQVYFTGDASFMKDTTKLAESTMKTGETVGIAVALLVLAIVFGAVAAAVLPIALGVAAVVGALGLTTLISHAFQLSFFVTNMITMMGLAVGIDYSLFVVTRFREERQRGLSKHEAIAKAGSTASRAVLISGMTVVLALCGLILFPLSIFQSMGIGSIVVVAVAILACLTLLPAVLSLLGDRVNAIRIPFIQKKNPQPVGTGNGFWVRTSRLVTRQPVISIVLAAGLLGSAAIPFLSKQTGMSGIAGLPDSLPAKQGFMVLQKEFGYGSDQPAKIVIDAPTASPELKASLDKLMAALSTDKDFVAARMQPFDQANLTVVSVNLKGDPNSAHSLAAVERLRAEVIPAAFSGTSLHPMVTGVTASMVDFNQITNHYTPIVFGFVLVLSFILLTLAFRSIVVPATAILMNLFSVGASYGLIVLVFQQGVGAKLFGFQKVDVIETWLPLFLFAVLFGLSMDYHVFLLSRIREKFKQCGDNTESVTFGLASTGRLITGAALIMVAVFGGFALGKMTMFQQMGFGLAVAVFLDATIVRSVLVPATMRLIGKHNWYLPKWLGWLPNISLGEPPEPPSAPPEGGKAGGAHVNPVLIPVPIEEEDRRV